MNPRNIASQILPFDGDSAVRPVHREIWPVPPVPFTAESRLDEPALDALVDFYVQAGVDGLFVLAYSGEAFELDDQEQLVVCRRVIERAAGRLRIVAAGNFRGELNDQIEQLKRIAELGPEAVIIFLSTLPDATRLTEDLLLIASQIDAKLGIYECPVPVHRLLSPDDVATLAVSGRFVFMKETSRDRDTYRAKLRASEGSALMVYQANWGQLPLTLEDGCPGFCGIVANVFPELVDAYCNEDGLSPTGREALHDILAEALSCMTRRHYPASMKYVLKMRGLPIGTASRMHGASNIDAEDKVRLDNVLELLSLLHPPAELIAAISERGSGQGSHSLRGPHRELERSPKTAEHSGYFEVD